MKRALFAVFALAGLADSGPLPSGTEQEPNDGNPASAVRTHR